ncbi:ABC transporter permease [Vulcanisaeta distributa]|uniref:ABC transporter permease n=1 Tax=Vulcanisaeta distributa TaxID=164451 RepID=UPI001FB4F8FB|nr:ABC transporter permease [Vulcanisaeta distributa]
MINSISAVTVLLIGLGLGISYKVNALATITFLILYLASIIGLNLIAGAVVLIVKQGNPIALFTSVASNLLGGVVFPTSVLPTWLRYISYSLSLTWALSGLRGAMLSGYGIPQLLNYLWPLVILALAYIVIGIALSNYAFTKILREGSVHMY